MRHGIFLFNRISSFFLIFCIVHIAAAQVQHAIIENYIMEDGIPFSHVERYHESLQNLSPAEVYFGTGQKKLKQRWLIKNRTLQAREKQFYENQLTW